MNLEQVIDGKIRLKKSQAFDHGLRLWDDYVGCLEDYLDSFAEVLNRNLGFLESELVEEPFDDHMQQLNSLKRVINYFEDMIELGKTRFSDRRINQAHLTALENIRDGYENALSDVCNFMRIGRDLTNAQQALDQLDDMNLLELTPESFRQYVDYIESINFIKAIAQKYDALKFHHIDYRFDADTKIAQEWIREQMNQMFTHDLKVALKEMKNQEPRDIEVAKLSNYRQIVKIMSENPCVIDYISTDFQKRLADKEDRISEIEERLEETKISSKLEKALIATNKFSEYLVVVPSSKLDIVYDFLHIGLDDKVFGVYHDSLENPFDLELFMVGFESYHGNICKILQDFLNRVGCPAESLLGQEEFDAIDRRYILHESYEKLLFDHFHQARQKDQ